MLTEVNLDPQVIADDMRVGYKPSASINNDIGFHVQGGLEYFIGKRFSLSANICQIFFNGIFRDIRKNVATLDTFYIKDEFPIKLDTLFGFAQVRVYF